MEYLDKIQYEYLNDDSKCDIKKIYNRKSILKKWFLKFDNNNIGIGRILKISIEFKTVLKDEVIIFNTYTLVILGKIQISIIYSDNTELSAIYNINFSKELDTTINTNVRAVDKNVKIERFFVYPFITSAKCLNINDNGIELYVLCSLIVFD